MQRIWPIILILCLFVSSAYADTALNAPPEDRVYHDIDILIAHGLVKDVIIGQRPYSRAEVARIISCARNKLGEKPSASKKISRFLYLDRLLAHYEKEYEAELLNLREGLSAEALQRLEFNLLGNSSRPRLVPQNNNQGGIDAEITSFNKYKQGLQFANGANYFISTKHNLYLSRYFAFTAEPRFEFDSDRSEARIHRLYAKGGWHNIELEAGRDNILWGQSEFGGVMLSANARPLDMVKISNASPWQAPWIFKYLGHMKATFFVSTLGPEREFKNTYFYGAKWTLIPLSFFELGVSHTIMMGGDGAPNASFWDPLTELFPFHKWGSGNINASNVANNAFGFLDLRITIPPLRGSVVYFDEYIEDSIVRAFRLGKNYFNQAAFITGLYSPRLTDSGSLGLRLEYHHTAPLTYRHGIWASGYALNRTVIGDALGPDADGIYSTLYWRPNAGCAGRLELAFEDYDSSTYYTQTNASGGGDKILKAVSMTHERRYRGITGIDIKAAKRIGFKFEGGYERIENWNFSAGNSANNWLLSTAVSLYFDEFNL
ncbi:MAG: hypothetical protein HYY43_02730 [Deltaproteobacteria bacterium]|nr:hypothetical protein [Deltaproteobacteria bacterium]